MTNPRLKPIYGILILLVFGVGGILGIYYTSQQDALTNPAGVNWDKQPAPASSELLIYAQNDQLYNVTEHSMAVSSQFNIEDLYNQSSECGTNLTREHFAALLAQFNADRGTQYEFRYKGSSQEPAYWRVVVLPNRPAYATLADFQNDFNICIAGGETYPTKITSNNLMFASSCGTGFDDGSGVLHGCGIIREAVEPTLQMK
ncbi:MAG: hypothetical protein WC734_00015 [Patescibacteria group bacterium]|jgi:hypothetical protein